MTTLSGSGSASNARSPRRRSTMRDVAALAGVSLKTVSRVVNAESGVSPDLTARVRKAAEQLAYRPDFTASNLRRADRRTGTIGLMVEDVGNEFSATVHAGVEDAANERGVAVLTASTAVNPDRERDVVRAFSSRRVDGLVAVPSGGDDSSLWIERDIGVPLVFVDRAPKGVVADCVLTNNREGTHEAIAHLAVQGHRKIAFLGGVSRLETAQDRYEGYIDALTAAGLPTHPSWVLRDLRNPEQATDATRLLLELSDPPTAIFAAQNLLCMGAFRALAHAHLQHSIALAGFDDFALADMLDPAVTVVAQDPRNIGYRAAELLFERMDADAGVTSGGASTGSRSADNDDAIRGGGSSKITRHHRVPSRLIVRESSLIPPRERAG